jgi:hypothetical protein
MANQVGESLADIAPRTAQARVRGIEMSHHGVLMVAFIKFGVVEGQRKRPQRRVGKRADQRHDAGGVEAATQVRGDRNVGAQLQAHGVDEQLPQFLRSAFDGPVTVRGGGLPARREAPVPVTMQFFSRPSLDRQHMSGWKTADAFEQRVRVDRPPVAQRLHQSLRMQDRALRQHGQQRLNFRTEPKASASARIKQRSYAGAVARQQQPAAWFVPQGYRKLAVEMLDKAIASVSDCV